MYVIQIVPLNFNEDDIYLEAINLDHSEGMLYTWSEVVDEAMKFDTQDAAELVIEVHHLDYMSDHFVDDEQQYQAIVRKVS